MTSDFVGRISEHKQELVDGFTKRYAVHLLVHLETFDDMDQAIRREKQLKRWRREWKVRLIEEKNPAWLDLYWELAGAEPPRS